FFFHSPVLPSIYTLSLHDALPIFRETAGFWAAVGGALMAAAALPVAVGVIEATAGAPSKVHLFSNGWFRFGLVLACLGLTAIIRSEEHTSELQSRGHLVCRLLLEK